NAKRQQVANARFHAGDVRRQGLEKFLKGCGPHDVVILDPPRAGPIPGVIETVADLHPGAVCHIFCNIDRAPDDLRVWSEHGYQVARAVPFDMFPGTPSIELLAVLKPAV
ncbi:MAG TPA: 23S rRNA (uracil-5-)-methyltransferase RumA, partial [Candidatus Xenobia bacterium]